MTSNVNSLSTEDIRFFKSEGYLIKRGILDAGLMERARESLWEAAPPEIDRHDPDTWSRPLPERREPPNVMVDHVWKFRERAGEDWMIRLLATDPQVWAMAEQLLGVGTLTHPDRIRGIYCNFPEGDDPPVTPTCHCDGHAFNLGVVGYIDRVDPDGGGLKVWPGSHRRFYYDFDGRFTTDRDERYARNTEYFDRQPYVEFDGDAGDIIFWHYRLGHAGSYNRSRQIRQAVFYDYVKQDLDEMRDVPPADDMWEDWSDEVRATPING